MSEVGWNGRSAGEDVDAWLIRLTGHIGAAVQADVQAAHKARKEAAFLAFGRGSRATELIHGNYCSAMRLRNLAAQHLARFDKGAFRASPLLHQKAGLWRLAPRADKAGTARILTHSKNAPELLHVSLLYGNAPMALTVSLCLRLQTESEVASPARQGTSGLPSDPSRKGDEGRRLMCTSATTQSRTPLR